MSTVLEFVRRVHKIATRAEREAPPHSGVYCTACVKPLRPDTVACSDCGNPNPLHNCAEISRN